MPCAEGEQTHKWADSLKTEEKTKSVDVGDERRTDPATTRAHVDRPDQCTNWELVRTGQDECRPTIERCSLERR